MKKRKTTHNLEREDITAYSELSASVDVENQTFENSMQILTSFISNVLLSEEVKKKLDINPTLSAKIQFLISQTMEYAEQKITVRQLGESREQAWQLFDKSKDGSLEKKMMRVVVCCLYDKQSSEFDVYGSGAIFESFFSTLLDLGKGYCGLFAAYSKNI